MKGPQLMWSFSMTSCIKTTALIPEPTSALLVATGVIALWVRKRIETRRCPDGVLVHAAVGVIQKAGVSSTQSAHRRHRCDSLRQRYRLDVDLATS